jgi:hypothetical protein
MRVPTPDAGAKLCIQSATEPQSDQCATTLQTTHSYQGLRGRSAAARCLNRTHDAPSACLADCTSDKIPAPRMAVALQFGAFRQQSETDPICTLNARQMTGAARFARYPTPYFLRYWRDAQVFRWRSAAHLTRDADIDFFRMTQSRDAYFGVVARGFGDGG